MTDLFFSVAKWENVATSCEILVANTNFLVALATRKAQFPTLNYYDSLQARVIDGNGHFKFKEQYFVGLEKFFS